VAPWNNSLRTLLEAVTSENELTKTEAEVTDSEAADVVENQPSIVADEFTGMVIQVIHSSIPEVKLAKVEVEATDPEKLDVVENQPSVLADSFAGMRFSVNQSSPKDIYEAVLPFILNHLEQPKDAKALADSLNVRKGQIEDWLNRAVKEGKVSKTKKPVAYVANKRPTLLSLLEKTGRT